MKYNLKTGNFYDFSKFRENILFPRSYFIPFANLDELAKTDIRNERYSSSLVECLSGEWDFAYFDNCNKVDNFFDTNKFEFDKVNVPSMWQYTGYEKPYYVNTRYQFKPNPPHIPTDCPVGIYRRFIDIDNLSLNYTLTFLGVAGGLELFVNGKFVGFSEGSHNTSEFEINEFLVEGKNEIVVQNHKWTNGTYLEAQDMFRSNGIFRDVLLFKTGENSIYDFEAKTKYLGSSYSLEFIPSLKLSDDCTLSVSLYDDGEIIASKSVNVSPKSIEKITFESLNVHEWSAECPYLYDMIITLSKGEDVIEAVRKNIGFKHIEIKGNVFYFNNQPIKLLGVNHHDSMPKTGYTMTVGEMEQDVSLAKQYNVNCIRTSHYPPDPTFLDLCDEYGIYVVDEADIETHGCETELHRPGACSHNKDWQQRYWDRVYRMYQRDRNHASITMWSLGNESHGYLNQDYCYDELKKLTPIPIHYEGVCRTKRFAYDVISHMYAWPNMCEKIAKGSLPQYRKKPFFQCEYAHAMGVGAGELERYIKIFYSAPNMLGGCIWEWADHAAYHENEKIKYTYGGDHGEEKHDGNFCMDGLFFPDRTPHSGAKQMKICYRPVRCERIADNKYAFTSHKYFENADFTVKYKCLTDGVEIKSGEFNISVAPQSKQIVEIDKINIDAKKNNVIIFTYMSGDFTIAYEQVVLSQGILKKEVPKCGKISVKPSESKLYITFENGLVVFDKKTGFINSYKFKEREMINQFPLGDFKGFAPAFYRAELDNDRNICKYWHAMKLETTANTCKGVSFTENNDYVVITAKIKSLAVRALPVALTEIKYTVYASGVINVDVNCLGGGAIKFLPRFGLMLEMPKEYENIKYFGLGEDVNLPDYKEHALMGIYNTTVDNLKEDYIKPQESATRCDVRFAEVTDKDGFGLRFDAVNKPFIFSASHYTSNQWAKAMHREELTPFPTTCINIDCAVLGAGSNACGPLPNKNDRVGSLKGKKFSFTVKPIGD